MTGDRGPLLSALLVTPDGYEPIRRSIEHLHAQASRDRIEVVIVAPRQADVVPEREVLAGFHGWKVVEAGTYDGLGETEALGVRAASAPVVVYVEEHSFPQPGWAEALIAAHEGPWAVVGPAIENENPGSRLSWASLVLDFGPWLPGGEAGPVDLLPSHQSSYKRELLLEYGDSLGELMETETVLQNDLRAHGHELYFEPAARTRHLNVSRLGDFLVAEFHNCRAFGGTRAAREGWSPSRRIAYVLGSPLIPLLRGWRVLRQARRSALGGRRALGILPAVAAGLVAATAGEVAGYVLGAGDSARRRLSFELNRMAHTNRRDRTGALGG